MRIKNMKVWAPVAAGVLATGAIAASAATLGTLDVQTLGTSTAIVADCQDNGVNGNLTIDWAAPAYSATGGVAAAPTYTEDALTLGNVFTACQGLPYSITVAKADGSVLQTKTGTTAAAATTPVTFNAPFDSALAEKVTLTIYG